MAPLRRDPPPILRCLSRPLWAALRRAPGRASGCCRGALGSARPGWRRTKGFETSSPRQALSSGMLSGGVRRSDSLPGVEARRLVRIDDRSGLRVDWRGDVY